MKCLEETNPIQATFFLDLFEKAKDAYTKDDYVPVQSEDHLHESYAAMCDHMDVEMVRLGFEFGRMYERLGVAV